MPAPKLDLDQKYSYADYLNWDENERWEILDGTPYLQAAPSRRHQEISTELVTQFHNYLKDKTCKVYHAPFCVRLDIESNNKNVKSVVEPDITIVCDTSKLDKKGCKGTPDMIIEILSPSNGKQDKLRKFNKYEKVGVKEYWIVDPFDNLVNVFTLQSNNRYGRPDIYSEDEKIKVSIFQDLEIDLKPVFDKFNLQI